MLLNKHIILSTISCYTPAQSPSNLSSQKSALFKVRLVFYKAVHVVRGRGGLPGANHGFFKAKPSNHNVHSTLQVTPPFLLTQNQCASTRTLSFLCRVRGGQVGCSIGF